MMSTNNLKPARFLLGFLFMFMAIGTSWAQSKLSGTVVDQNKEPLIGVSVVAKGLNVGTVTDEDGKYSFSVPKNAKTLVFSFIGMKTVEKSIKGNVINATLQDESHDLDDVVVIGYATTSKKDLTGSVVSVGEKALKDIPVNNVMQAISGRMAGVQVTTTEGSPDATVNIRVRAGGSITQDNSPLFIVDGFQVPTISDIPSSDILSIDILKDAASTAIYGAQGANGVVVITTKSARDGKVTINFNSYLGFNKVYNMYDVLSPYDYVYYQRELDYSGDAMAENPSAGFFGMYGRWEDIGIYKAKSRIDWQDQLYGNTGLKQNYNLSIMGGNKNFRTTLNASHDDESYVLTGSSYVRDAVSLKINNQFNQQFSFDATAKFTNTVINGASVSSGGKLRDGVKYAPVKSLTSMDIEDLAGGDEDLTSPEVLSSLRNPLYSIENEYKEQTQFLTTYNAGVTWNIIKGLKFRTQASYAFSYKKVDNVWAKGTGESSAAGGMPVAKRIDDRGNRWSWQNTLSYDWKNKIHRMNYLIGQELNTEVTDNFTAQSKFYPEDFSVNDVLAMWNYGTPLPSYTTKGEPTRTFSYFARANYTYQDRYLLTATVRLDGKSVFAPGNRWGFFPGMAAAWRISQEDFMQSTEEWLSNLKLRISYGMVGNARVPASWRREYITESTANKQYYINDLPQSALRPITTLYNSDLTWEKKVSQNIGLDFGFFNERLSGAIDLYSDKNKDLIMRVPLPTYSGYNDQYQNVGQTSNRGIEITVNGQIYNSKNISISANANIAFNKNKVDKFVGANGNMAYYQSGWGLTTNTDDYVVQEGQPIGLMYGFVTEGVYTADDFDFIPGTLGGGSWKLKATDANGVALPSYGFIDLGNYFGPGALKLKDLDGDGKITSNDRTVIGKAQPKFTGGFGLNTRIYGFDIAALFNFSYGNKVYNANKIDFTTYSGSKKYQNILQIMNGNDRYKTIDPITGNNVMFGTYADPQRFVEINSNATLWSPILNSTFLHSWAIEDGSFLRLNNLTVGYTLPSNLMKKVFIGELRFYATANNLFVWTKYSGQDPEVDTRRSTPLTPNVDYSAYPKARSYVFGVNLTL